MRRPNSRSRRRDRLHGFTLLELLVTLAVAGLLVTTAVWSARYYLVGLRVSAAARELVSRSRNAAAIAARTNRPVELRFVESDGPGCTPRYEFRTVGTGATTFERICLASEYPGVRLSAGAMSETGVRCNGEPDLGNCTLCEGTRTVTFYPSGEVATSGVDADGDSVVFSVRGDTSSARTLAVGIRNISGKIRVYRPNASASAWECP